MIYPIYKAIKARLVTVAPGYYFINQYVPGKDNTSYKVPAIYVETPKNTTLTWYGKRTLTAKNAQFKIHYISYAPFKNHDNAVQDSAVAAHEAKVSEILALITGWCVRQAVAEGQPVETGLLLTQQFLPVAASLNNFSGECVYSVLTFNTEVYKR